MDFPLSFLKIIKIIPQLRGKCQLNTNISIFVPVCQKTPIFHQNRGQPVDKVVKTKHNEAGN